MRRSRTSILRSAAVVLTLWIYGRTYAQSAPTPPKYIVTTAVITLRGCGLPDPFSVVIGHEDRNEYTIEKDTHGVVDLDPANRFDADNTYARVFFGSRATDCQKSRPGRRQDVFVGMFSLTCLDGKTRTLTISAPSADVSYVRAMKNSPQCWQGSFVQEAHDVRAVLFSGESVRLQFGEKEPNAQSPGLLIHDPSVIPDPEKIKDVELNRNQVIQALAAQRNGSLLSTRSTTSPNARTGDETTINSRLATLHLHLENE